MIKTLFYISLIVIISCLYSCKTTNPCPKELEIGNLGTTLNTGYDDHLPVIYGNTLYFTSTRKESDDREQIFMSEIVDGKFTYPVIDKSLPINDFQKTSSPTFFENPKTGIKELYFAALNPKSKKGNRDIFFSVDSGQGWSKPVVLEYGISTEYYESHPTISPDGSMLLFSSDRPGGVGDVDLYLSHRQADGSWSNPVNLGNTINTPKAEIAPVIAYDGSLFFSSKGYGGDSTFDIIRAEQLKPGVWQNPRPMKYPINTKYDEAGTAIWDNKIIISSNRSGGCGGYDIYSFDLCGPVEIAGEVVKNGSHIKLNGTVELNSADKQKISEQPVGDDGKFHFPVEPGKIYTLKYSNTCLKDLYLEQTVNTPCNDTSSVKLIMKLNIPEQYTFSQPEEYIVPYFVTGYYYPNTTQNLQALRMKFDYNLLGVSDTTNYIQYPSPEYDEYAKKVDEGIKEIVKFILDKLQSLDDPCSSGLDSLTIHITGYSDPRLLSDFAKYNDEPIDDESTGIQVKRGDKMTNELLSLLRAYNTERLLQSKLEQEHGYIEQKDKIIWKIEGKGIDLKPENSNDIRRRVEIKVEMK